MNVRYQAGLHAKAINELTPHDSEELDEILGHTPIEAVAGGCVGFLTAVLLLGI
jgi:acid phosphatase family membrane protein YuiD